MALDRGTVGRMAALARIQIAPEELDGLAVELGGILSWVEALAEVDTDGVEEMTGVGRSSAPWRADEPDDGGYPERVLANAPERVGGFFAVPKVVE